jgi:glycosyltransferase involved in cell wall biosynthesis
LAKKSTVENISAQTKGMKKAIIFTYIPSPYRTIVFDELEKMDDTALQVVYMSKGDAKFAWKNQQYEHNPIFLEDKISGQGKWKMACAILKLLNEQKPQAVITCGFTWPMLLVMSWAFLNGKKRLVNTDAWEKIEGAYSRIHKIIRRLIYPTVHAAIPVSEKGKLMFRNYGIPEKRIFISHYAIDNDRYRLMSSELKKFDLIFSGQMIDRKMPFFFSSVVAELKKNLPNLRVLILGNGELKESFMQRMRETGVDWEYPGFIQPQDLPRYYSSAKILLFPTQSDSWGVVANDAMASGTLVMTCDNAGCANELVKHNVNGWVLPLDTIQWVNQIEMALKDNQVYTALRQQALIDIEKYHPKKSAEMLKAAISFVLLHE